MYFPLSLEVYIQWWEVSARSSCWYHSVGKANARLKGGASVVSSRELAQAIGYRNQSWLLSETGQKTVEDLTFYCVSIVFPILIGQWLSRHTLIRTGPASAVTP